MPAEMGKRKRPEMPAELEPSDGKSARVRSPGRTVYTISSEYGGQQAFIKSEQNQERSQEKQKLTQQDLR
jgi:hypothetical protein